ncbi:MAG: zinc ABC transporter substrate-binding protein [Clostridia bacterium]|nr:zinc ABC transporter substrate-binding protein [Clostridia bacterium]
MKKIIALCLALLLCAPALASAETIVTSFYPIHIFALNLLHGVEGVTLVGLTDSGAGCLHDYQLQTGDMKALAKADAFLINGAGMEGFLEGVFEAFPTLPVTDASVGVELLEDCSDGHGHDHDDHGHDHAYNAHIWLDAQNAVIMVGNLAEGLIAALPEHAEAIAANRDAYITRLTALDAELEAALSALPSKDIITFHEAFPYFANAYGLNVAAVINRDPDDALSPRALAELCKLVESLGAPPLFVEPQYEDMAAQTIARETGASLHTLDPIVTGPETDIPLTYYEDVMRRNAAVLAEALSPAEPSH